MAEVSVEKDVAIGLAAGLLVGFYIASAFKVSLFGASQLAVELLELAMVTPFGYFIRLLFLAVTLIFILGSIVRLRDNGIAIIYTFLIGLFVTFL